MNPLVQKKRLVTMVAIDVACLIVGVGAIIGHLAFDIAPLLWVFVAAVALGVGAQLWFILGWMRAERAA
jgi:hypothetical protein